MSAKDGFEDRLVWHYTTTAGLSGILIDHKLWATSVSFLNDSEETRYAVDVMREVTARLRAIDGGQSHDYFVHALDQPSDHFGYDLRFVACASGHGDALEMWRAYGYLGAINGTFAVGLDPTVPLGVHLDPDKASARSIRSSGSWKPVDYRSKPDAIEHILKVLHPKVVTIMGTTYDLDPSRNFAERQGAIWKVIEPALDDLQVTGKHKAFEAEDESRLSFRVAAAPIIKTRPGRHGPVPYVELTKANGWGLTADAFDLLPVRKIVTWPGAPRTAARGVAAALTQGGYSHNYETTPTPDQPYVEICESELPFI